MSATDGSSLAKGGSLLAIAMLVANAGNYILNALLGGWLTPAEFADANLMVTIMLLVTAIAISVQLIAARFASLSDDVADTMTSATWLERRALAAGLLIGVVLVAAAPWWRDFFNSESAMPFAVLGIGMPFYLAQGVGRGVLQGHLQFGPLATTFVVEMIVRLGVAVPLVAAGFGVLGATAGLTASFVTTWIHVRILTRSGRIGSAGINTERRADMIAYAGPVALLLLGQIIINNGDVLIAKRFLDPDTAGIYAAIALVGRAVFFLSWSVATTLFPASAQRDAAGESSDGLLWGGLGIVAALGACFAIGGWTLGGVILGEVFGPEYADVSGPLGWYALATSLFAMANLIVSHHLAMGRLREALVLLGGAVLQTALLIAGRGSIDSLITAQVIAMGVLFVAVLASWRLSPRSAAHPVTLVSDPTVTDPTSNPGSVGRSDESFDDGRAAA